jgi:hypothetical protein
MDKFSALLSKLFGEKEPEPSQDFNAEPSQSFEPAPPGEPESPVYNHSTLIAQLLARGGPPPETEEESDENFPTLKELLKKYVGSI